jgi:hypothetical protein
MKSHSSKASRKSFDVTKMSGPEIAAEMSRQMTEFKSARKHPDPAITRKADGPAEMHSMQSRNHPFLRASLAAGAGSATAPSSVHDRDLPLDKPLVLGTERGSSGLAFLRRGARNERSQSIAERRSPQYPRERSYRAGLLAGVSLVLVLIGFASAALWKSGTLPEFVERSLQDALRPATATPSEPAPGPIASRDVAAKSSPAAVDQPPPIPPTPIVLMIAPAPAPISNATLTVDTLSAITALQLDAPAIDIDHGNFQSVMSDHDGTGAAAPLRVETGAGLSADSPATSSTSEVLKQLAKRPSLKPALDVEAPAEPETTTAVPISIDTAADEQPEVPFVARIAKPFVPKGTSSASTEGQSTASTPAAEPNVRSASAAQDPGAPDPEDSLAQKLSPLAPPIVIRSIDKVSNAPGAASIEMSEQPVDGDQRAASSLGNGSSHDRRTPNSETDAGRDGGLGVADVRPDGPSASGRGHGDSPSGGTGGGGSSGSGSDPGNGTGGSGGSGDGSTGGDGGTSGGSGGSGGGSTGGDGGSGGDDGGSGGSSGGGDGGAGGDGSDGGDSGGDGGGAGGDGSDGGDNGGDGGGAGGDGSDGGDNGGDGGGAGGGGSDGGDGGGDAGGDGSDGGDSGGDAGGDGSDGGDDGGDGGSSGGDSGGLGGALGGAVGGLGGALGGALGGN